MQTINLRLKNVTAIPVTKAIRAVKGDVILVEEDGTTSVISPSVYRAMSILQGHSDSPASRETKHSRSQTSKAKRVWPMIQTALETNGALTTSQLAQIVEVPWKEDASGRRAYIGALCRRRQREGELESVEVEALSVTGQVRMQSLWDLKNKDALPCGNKSLAERAAGLGLMNGSAEQ